MAIIASDKGGALGPVSDGVHLAVCTGVIDIGEQYSELFKSSSRKVILLWEVDETAEIDGAAVHRRISREYTLSLNSKSNLRKHLEAWRGRAFTAEELGGFDLKNILGKPCMLQVNHTEDKKYANIVSVMSALRSAELFIPSESLIYFDLSDKACIPLLSQLPEWIQNKIRSSDTWRELTGDVSGQMETPFDDSGDLPF